MHFGDGWTGPVVGYGADSVDFKAAVSAAVAEAMAVKSTKWCAKCKRPGHDTSEHHDNNNDDSGGKKEFKG
eukprot:224957-Rhodomonas_salina.1